MKLHFGIDLGGTKIEIIVLDENFNILHTKRVLTEAFKGYIHVTNKLKDLYRETLDIFLNPEHTLGIGSPGSLSSYDGVLQNSTIPCHNGLPLDELLKKELNQNLFFQNDANCFVLAESLLGAGRNKRFVFGVILGTGCGGGIFFNNQLWSGNNNLAGEWGHSIIDIDGPDCFCGKKGCINAFISGTALEKKIRHSLNELMTAKDFLNKKSYSPSEEKIIDEFILYFNLSISNIVNIIDPEVIVIGGGLSNFKKLYNNIDNSQNKNKNLIVKTMLGDTAGVIGAALLGSEFYKKISPLTSQNFI